MVKETGRVPKIIVKNFVASLSVLVKDIVQMVEWVEHVDEGDY